MENFFNGRELSFLLLLTMTMYILVWHIPSKANQLLLIYFIVVLIYTLIKFIFSSRFREFPLIKTFFSILLLLIASEFLIAYKYDELSLVSFDGVFKYFSTLNLDYIYFLS
ncbi:hypothetical protein [Priestia flexa]|uniref:hypothetical protein n=1 Tax=Priestia flexa TaxID=86664 RepID=UPI003FD14A75